jgi:5-methylcytosine-specific restriction enzyme subunit McrC
MPIIELRENLDSTPVVLSPEQRDAIRRAIPALMVTPAPGEGQSYVLNPRNVVGALDVGGLRVVIQPKLPIARLLFLLGYSVDPKRWLETPFEFEEDVDVVDAVASAFAFLVERALRRGLLQGYVVREEALPTVRGRIRFGDQLRDRLGIIPPIECRFDEFTADIPLNRILLAATQQLRRLPLRDRGVRTRLAHIAAIFADVKYVEYGPRDLPELHYDRLTAHLRPAAELARLVIRGRSFELDAGSTAGEALLLDMSRVFEDFVLVALREALELSERQFPRQLSGHSLWLDIAHDGGVLKLRPDLSWWEGPTCLFIGDAKYKRTPALSGVENPDMYQLLAYAVATDLPTGLLVYAAGNGDVSREYAIRHSDKVLLVRVINLDQEPGLLLEEFATIASSIRAMARRPTARAEAA